MWNTRWRERVWQQLDTAWDVIIVGGGITGAGILREATRAGLRALLVEQRDFAWGTSSRSSKLVHGGLRYLASGQIKLTRASVHERERLLQNAPGLVHRLPFVLADASQTWSKQLLYRAGLIAYDLLALRWQHQRISAETMHWMLPHAEPSKGLVYYDAQTDDARLVVRLLRESVQAGATALNYARVSGVLRNQHGVCGVQLHDPIHNQHSSLQARVVINATGAWADGLRAEVGASARMRPLRGSHLVFAAWRLPIEQALTIAHPHDKRPIFVLPWEGATIVGTTDVDHHESLNNEPQITLEEVDYLMQALATIFPTLNLTIDDIISTWSGVRPVIDNAGVDPSKATRDHAVWLEQGLLTVTGGKLTTFRLIALDALRQLKACFPHMQPDETASVFMSTHVSEHPQLSTVQWQRLQGRYGNEAHDVVALAEPGELIPIEGTPTLWCELRWAARNEGIVQLDDLLLRRVRIGHTLPNGAAALFPQLEHICRTELGWSSSQWLEQASAYTQLIKQCYGVPVKDREQGTESIEHRT